MEVDFFLSYFHWCQFNEHVQITFSFHGTAWPGHCLFLGDFLCRAVDLCSDVSEQSTVSTFRMINSCWSGCWYGRLMCVVATFIGRLALFKPWTLKGWFACWTVTSLHACSLHANKMAVLGLEQALKLWFASWPVTSLHTCSLHANKMAVLGLVQALKGCFASWTVTSLHTCSLHANKMVVLVLVQALKRWFASWPVTFLHL